MSEGEQLISDEAESKLNQPPENEQLFCCVCTEHENLDLILLQCHRSHVICCSCYNKVNKCPLCRTKFKDHVSVYNLEKKMIRLKDEVVSLRNQRTFLEGQINDLKEQINNLKLSWKPFTDSFALTLSLLDAVDLKKASDVIKLVVKLPEGIPKPFRFNNNNNNIDANGNIILNLFS